MNQNDKEYKDKEYKQIDKEYKQNDLLTEYGTATTAYLLMAMSIDSLERKNKQLETENVKLRGLVQELWEYICIGADQNGQNLHDRTRELGIEVAKSWEIEGWQLV